MHYHDTASAYAYGCRCPIAREESRIVRKRRREGRTPPGLVSPLGVVRRLEALMAMGWTSAELSPYFDLTYREGVNHLLQSARHRMVLRATHEQVVQVYEKLCATPGPSGKTRRSSARKGWPPPFAWDDIDDPGEVPAPYVEEKKSHNIDYEEVKFLCDSGVWVEDIAKRMGVNPSSIVRLADRRGDVVRAKKLNRGVRWGDLGK